MYVGDILGHKRTFILGLVITIIGSILQASAFLLLQLTIARFVGVTATGSNWQSETVQPGLKGAIVMLQSTFICTGLALAGWLEYGLALTEGSVTWRHPLAFPYFPCLIFLCWAPV
ncbi:hypothetical protein BDV39DRAFT_167857 [Aspergillus sergii]|uniref:Major facilitator superfamily (MFS) profile domain-containing protein n=1 Tax=Aspergillus sergii TaxID=1034303 RepID=A0A5N6XFC7_9EURO|nr:hypothetical protein BDV39DRAFT_167857 [Aspergillus sergii]